jgi:D-aminopeptidase
MRRRLRQLGYEVGRFPTGRFNAIVDVPDVRVGHATVDGIHTGVTAVLPHGGNPFADKVLAACHVVNGFGKTTGLTQLEELGTLESPLLLTSTVSVGPVWEGGLRWLLELNPEAARDRDTMNVVVAECFDGWLGDGRGLHIRAEHALDAIAAASRDESAEGSVGAGAGTTCFGFKAGVGGSSRRAGGATLGCLVLANYGRAGDRHLLAGAPVDGPPADAGSAIVLLATDAPLSERQLRRLAARGTFGLGRAGSIASSGSGEYVIAFSTAHRIPHRLDASYADFRFLRDDSPELRELFEAAVEVTHEAILNSLCSADAAEGRDGHRVEALPYELLERLPWVRRSGA